MTTVHNSAVGADVDASMVLAATKRVLVLGRYFCLRPLSGILYRLGATRGIAAATRLGTQHGCLQCRQALAQEARAKKSRPVMRVTFCERS
jgi:hypothetical protein